MTLGDRVCLADAPYIQGTIIRLPRSEGRKRPRCVIQTDDGERWFFLDELKPVTDDSTT